MAARKKDPAIVRTVGLFTGKTALEEAEDLAREEEPEIREHVPRDVEREAEDCAIRWLGLDAFHEGDDIKIAVHPSGHAVMVLVSTQKKVPYGTTTIKLSRAQWKKLRAICNEPEKRT